MIPRQAAAISSGTAHRISFFTPDSEVKVDAPVKFIARYAVIAGIRKNQARTSSLPDQCSKAALRRTAGIRATTNPRISPLRAKALPGNHGKRIGVKMVPANRAVTSAKAANRPCIKRACPIPFRTSQATA